MCKIAMMSGIKQSKIKEAWMLARALAPLMSKNDDDGFGYAAITKKGDVFVQRWLDNDQAFKYTAGNKRDLEIQDWLKDAVEPLDDGYSSVGTIAKNSAVAMVLHARMATCEKGIKNVHPFVVNGQALIHNGVISNPTEVLNKYDKNNTKLSTCDSEAIAFSYAANDVSNNPEAIKILSEDLSGYYACAVLHKNEKGEPVMDVFKSSAANLFAAYVPQADVLVYCTSLEILKQAVKDCGFSHYRPNKVLPGNLIRHDALTGVGKVVHKFAEPVYRYSNYGGYKDWDDSMYSRYAERHGASSASKESAASASTVTALPGNIDKNEAGGTVIDASTTGRTYNGRTYNSWEEYQDMKYGEDVRPAHKEEPTASEIIAAEERAKQAQDVVTVMKGVPLPDYVKGLKSADFRNRAIKDWQEIHLRYTEFRTKAVRANMINNKQQQA